MHNFEKIKIDDFRNTIFKKTISGSYLDKKGVNFIFKYIEVGVFKKKRSLFINEKNIVQCVGKNGLYFSQEKYNPFFLEKFFLKGFYLYIPSERGSNKKCIDGLKIGKPSPNNFSDLILLSEKKAIFHCLIKKNKYLECFSKIYPQDIIIEEFGVSNLINLSIFFLGCSTSLSPDVFVGVE